MIPARKIEVRQARRSDLDKIAGMERRSFLTDAWDPELLLDYLRECPELFLVAKAGGRIAGYAITCETRFGAELVSIAVDPDFRNLGVGTALITHTAARLRRLRQTAWSLNVRITNHTAIRFYRGFGFVRTRTVRGYYEDGGDAWRMRLELKRPAKMVR